MKLLGWTGAAPVFVGLTHSFWSFFILSPLQALQEGVALPTLVDIFCTEGYNKQAKLHYLGPLLANLTQLPEARKELLAQDR